MNVEESAITLFIGIFIILIGSLFVSIIQRIIKTIKFNKSFNSRDYVEFQIKYGIERFLDIRFRILMETLEENNIEYNDILREKLKEAMEQHHKEESKK